MSVTREGRTTLATRVLFPSLLLFVAVGGRRRVKFGWPTWCLRFTSISRVVRWRRALGLTGARLQSMPLRCGKATALGDDVRLVDGCGNTDRALWRSGLYCAGTFVSDGVTTPTWVSA